MLNIRQQSGTTKRRLIARSNDGGQSWDSVYFDPELITPVCQSSLFLFQNATHTLLLYSGPNSTEERIRMTLKASENNGATWPIKKEIYAGISAYSDLTQINESQIGLLRLFAMAMMIFWVLEMNGIKVTGKIRQPLFDKQMS